MPFTVSAKWRKTIYAVLATAHALEIIWDVLPEPLEGKVLASLSVLGFGVAFRKATDITVVRD